MFNYIATFDNAPTTEGLTVEQTSLVPATEYVINEIEIDLTATASNADCITDCNSYMKQLLADKAEIDLMQTRGSALLRELLARCYKLHSQMEVEKDEVLQTAFKNYTEQRGFEFKANVKTMNKILYTVFCNPKTYKNERKTISGYATALNNLAKLNVAAGDALHVLNSEGIENLRKKDSKVEVDKTTAKDKHYLASTMLEKQHLFTLDSVTSSSITVGTQVGNLIVLIGNRMQDGKIVIRSAEHNNKLIDLVRENYYSQHIAGKNEPLTQTPAEAMESANDAAALIASFTF
jgi:hypothetical protein